MEFQGRAVELAVLQGELQAVAAGTGPTRGRAVIVTGRRRVGKSRLVQEFCDRCAVPSVVFQATRGRNPVAECAEFTAVLAQTPMPGAELVAGLQAG
ncbi:MAG: ATP-binding protein, partial [Pseudonocardia sp.]|nr:ATP-binding protein [Pseudonocardia sp.]